MSTNSSSTNNLSTNDAPTTDSKTTKSGIGSVLLALGAGATIGFGLIAKDWITASFMLAILIMSLRGFSKGGATIAASVLAMAAGVHWAELAAPTTSETLDNFFNIPDQFREPASLVGAGILIAACVYLVTRVSRFWILKSLPFLKRIDQWVGAVMGAVQGGLLVVLVLFSASTVEPIAQRQARQPYDQQSNPVTRRVCDNVIRFMDSARESSLRPVLSAMDPLKKRINDQAQEMAHQLSQRPALDPAMHTGLRSMADQLRNDPDALRNFSSRFGIDETSVRTVLESEKFRAMIGGGDSPPPSRGH